MHWISIGARESSRPALRGLYVKPSKRIATEMEASARFPEITGHREKRSKQTTVRLVSEGAYLPIVGDIEVISHRWVFCCQGVNLYKKRGRL